MKKTFEDYFYDMSSKWKDWFYFYLVLAISAIPIALLACFLCIAYFIDDESGRLLGCIIIILVWLGIGWGIKVITEGVVTNKLNSVESDTRVFTELKVRREIEASQPKIQYLTDEDIPF